jgi:hypothetical protein
VTREEAAAALRTLVFECIEKKSTPGATQEEVRRWKECTRISLLDGIERAVSFYAEAQRGGDDQKRATRLEKATERYLRELRQTEPMWSFMWFWRGKPEEPRPEHKDLVRSAELALGAARATAEGLRKGKRQPDRYRAMFGVALATTFSQLGGRPTHSNNHSTFEKPLTEFGRFVRLAILASPHAEHPRVKQIKGAFDSFVRAADDTFAGRTRGGKSRSK